MGKLLKDLTEKQVEKLINDVKSGKFTNAEIIEKFDINATVFYALVGKLRKQGKLPQSEFANRIKAALAARKENRPVAGTKIVKEKQAKNEPVSVKPVLSEYRTVYFTDFSVQIHKKSLTRLVVDRNNNLHILSN